VLANPLVIIQFIAAILLLGGLIHMVLNQLQIKRDIRAIQHHLEARP
jgi:hypothetical protein